MHNGAQRKLVAAMLLFGSIGIFVRGAHAPAAQLVVWRVWIGSACIGAALAVQRPQLPHGLLRRRLPLLLLGGAAMGANWLFLFEAYAYTTVSAATLAYYCAPVAVLLGGAALYREQLSWRHAAGMGAVLAGMALVNGLGAGGINPVRGVLCGLAAAGFYAVLVLCNKAMQGLPALVVTFWQLLGAAAVMTPYALFSSGGWAVPKGTALLCVLVLGAVHTGLAYLLYFSAVPQLPAKTTAVLSYLDPLSALVWSALFLGERLSLPQLAGAALVLGGAFFAQGSRKYTRTSV